MILNPTIIGGGGLELLDLYAASNGSHTAADGTAYNRVTVNVQPSLQNKTVDPKVGSQTVQKDSGYGYYGLDTVTVNSIPASPIMLMIPNWVTGASITYNGTVYTSGQVIQMYATEKITLTMPATGATVVINGKSIRMLGTSLDIVIFANAIMNMSGASPYRVDLATMDGIGGRVPVEYIFVAWELYDGAMLLMPGFTYAELLILEDTSYITIGFLQSGFTVTAYNDTTGEFCARGWYAAYYNKSTKLWSIMDYTSSASSGGHYFAEGKFTTTLITYGGETVFPTFKTAGGGGGGPWTIDLTDCYNASATYNNTVYTDTTFTVPDGAFVVFTLEQGPTTGDRLEIYLNNVLVSSGGSDRGYPTYSMLVHSDVAVAEGSWNETYITAQ